MYFYVTLITSNAGQCLASCCLCCFAIVETAGGAGLQLFVDAGVPVDSELIRECVNEVLTETVALMLGERETQRVPAEPAQTPEAHAQEVLHAHVSHKQQLLYAEIQKKIF